MSARCHCYGTRPLGSPLSRAIRMVLSDARGYFKSSGLTASEIRGRIARQFGVEIPTTQISFSLNAMRNVRRSEAGTWKVVA